MKRNTVCVALGLIGLAGFAATATGANDDGHSPKTPLAHAVGAAKNCIPITSIRDSEVQDDWTIDFHAATGWGRIVHLNTKLRSASCATPISLLSWNTVAPVAGRVGLVGWGCFSPCRL